MDHWRLTGSQRRREDGCAIGVRHPCRLERVRGGRVCLHRARKKSQGPHRKGVFRRVAAPPSCFQAGLLPCNSQKVGAKKGRLGV